MNINLHIERLILDGLPVTTSQGLLVRAAIEAQLSHLLRAEGLNPELRAGGALRSVKAGGIHVANSSPTHLGQQIGRAVYDGIGNKPK
jgi:hypothetical protein